MVIQLSTPVATPAADAKIAHRATVLAAAYEAHPERFVRGVSVPHALPREVWINPPPARGPVDAASTSVTPLALRAGGGVKVQGLGGAAPVAGREAVAH